MNIEQIKHAEMQRRANEGLLRWKVRQFACAYPSFFNGLMSLLCSLLGHSFVDAYSVNPESLNGDRQYRHFCPRCMTFGPWVGQGQVIAWRERHGILWAPSAYPLVKRLWLRLSYAARTLLRITRNDNERSQVFRTRPM